MEAQNVSTINFEDFEALTHEVDAQADSPKLFELYLNRYAQKAGDIINHYIPSGSHPDMETYLYAPLRKYSENGGKRHRPLICVAACAAVGGVPSRAFSSAAAIEHFHTAALIHDDIADDASLRRGEPLYASYRRHWSSYQRRRSCLSIVNGIVMRDPQLEDSLKVRVAIELVVHGSKYG